MSSAFEFTSQAYPVQPGCYLMKDRNGRVIYVGKAKNLRRRLASYFQKRHRRRRTRRLVQTLQDIEIIIVHNETESLLLENNLIKHYQPRFNRMLKAAGSGYSYIALTTETVPRFIAYNPRRRRRESYIPPEKIAQLFGPFASRRFRDAVLAFVNDSYQLPTCDPMPTEICLRYHMHKCSGICAKRISKQGYAESIDRARAFFKHQHVEMLRQIKAEMQACADALNFERAQWLKDQAAMLEQALERQVVERDLNYDQHVLVFGGGQALVAQIHAGTLKHMDMVSVADTPQQFILERYCDSIPEELIVTNEVDTTPLADQLSAQHGHKIRITQPQRGVKRKLLELCAMNFAYRTTGQVSV